MTKVYISYSHDSDSHRDFVLKTSNLLREDGLDCLIDQYINGFPPEGWQTWAKNQIQTADFVLLICTELYLRRYNGDDTEGGKGVKSEGEMISKILRDSGYNTKFIPIIPEGGDITNVPLPLQQYSIYTLPSHYEDLYRYLTGQPKHHPATLGSSLDSPEEMPVSTPVIDSDETSKNHNENSLNSDTTDIDSNEKNNISTHIRKLNKLLDKNTKNKLLQIIGTGASGKTTLIREWLKTIEKNRNLIAWNFSSETTTDFF